MANDIEEVFLGEDIEMISFKRISDDDDDDGSTERLLHTELDTAKFHDDLAAKVNHSIVNIAALCGCFFLLFSSYCALQNLAGVLVDDGPLHKNSTHGSDFNHSGSISGGVASYRGAAGVGSERASWGLIVIGAVYVSLTLCSLVASALVRRAGEKWAIVCSTLAYAVFMAAYFYPRPWVLIPAALLCGLGASTLWAAQGAYLTRIAHIRARATGKDAAESVTLYNSIFWGVFSTTQIIGNGLSFLVIQYSSGRDANDSSTKEWDTNSILFTFYTASAIVGAVLMCATKNDKLMQIEFDEMGAIVPEPPRRSLKESIIANLKLVRNREVAPLIPLMVFSGVQEPIVWSWMTTKMVIEQKEINKFMVLYGFCSLASSVSFGKLGTNVSRALAFILFGCCLEAAMTIYILFIGYPSVHDDFYDHESGKCKQHCWLWIISFMTFGITDGILNTQVSNTISILHQDISVDVYAHWKVWQSLAIALLFFINGSVETSELLPYINSTVLLTSMVGGLIGYTYIVVKNN